MKLSLSTEVTVASISGVPVANEVVTEHLVAAERLSVMPCEG